MFDTTKFILEVLGSSLLIAYFIRSIGPSLPIPATDMSAIAIVLTPALVIGGLLAWRAMR